MTENLFGAQFDELENVHRKKFCWKIWNFNWIQKINFLELSK